MDASGRSRIEVGRVLGESFSVYGRHLVTLLASAFVLFVVVGVLTALLVGPSRNELSWGDLLLVLLAIAIRIAADALYTGFVVTLVRSSRHGSAGTTAGDLLRSAAPAIPSLVVLSIVTGIAISVGLVLLVIPGLILLTIWAVAAPAVVVEGAGPLAALGRSVRLVRGQGWRVFWVLVVVWLLVAVIGWVLGLIGDAIGDGAYGVAVTLAALLTAPIHALAVSVMYFDLGGSGAQAGVGGAGTHSAGSAAGA